MKDVGQYLKILALAIFEGFTGSKLVSYKSYLGAQSYCSQNIGWSWMVIKFSLKDFSSGQTSSR